MATDKDALLRSSLLVVGASAALVGLCTFSFRKLFATYLFGSLAIAGVLLPDWEFFDRDMREWLSPMPLRRDSSPSDRAGFLQRFKAHPLRVALFIIIYSFGVCKWWSYISN